MSVERVSYSAEPEEIKIEHRPGGEISDIWIRRNILSPQPAAESSENGVGTGWTADEAYMQIATPDCPTLEAVGENFDVWWGLASEWTGPNIWRYKNGN